jgi:CheY-like chemotaxis protein/two-component sensor histidine kinase
LASLKALAGQLAHDFNNFLAPLLGYLTLIREEAPPRSPLVQYVATMENAARKTELIIDRVSWATRPQKYLQLDQVDFAALVEREIEQWQRGLPAAAGIEVHMRLERCQLRVDVASWQRVLRELLSNVRFALATGGLLEVALAVKRLTHERAAELGLAVPEVVELTFRDNGFGMSAATARRAFEPFFSTRSRTEAAGLGLSLVHTVVHSHAGQVELETAPEVGTTVWIWLPVLPGAPSQSQADLVGSSSTKGSNVRSRGIKVLLVEDDPVAMEVTRSTLQRAGFDVVTARRWEDGVQSYSRHRRGVGLVIASLSVPTMSGVEPVKEIRKLDPQVPIVLISGATGMLEEEALVAATPPRPLLLKKPFKLGKLIEAVGQLVG